MFISQRDFLTICATCSNHSSCSSIHGVPANLACLQDAFLSDFTNSYCPIQHLISSIPSAGRGGVVSADSFLDSSLQLQPDTCTGGQSLLVPSPGLMSLHMISHLHCSCRGVNPD